MSTPFAALAALRGPLDAALARFDDEVPPPPPAGAGNGVEEFGWEPSRSKTGGTKAVGTGPDAGRVLYGKRAESVLSGKKGKAAAPVPAPAPTAPAPRTVPPIDPAIAAKVRKAMPQFQPKPAAPATATPPASSPLAHAAAQPTPKETAYLATQHASDTARFGPRAANILRAAAHAVRNWIGHVAVNTAKIGITGAGALGGGLAGSLIGGPAGSAVGAVGGAVLGQVVADRAHRIALSLLGGKGRLRATGRRLARAGVPAAAGAAVGGPVAAAGMGATAAMLTQPAGWTAAVVAPDIVFGPAEAGVQVPGKVATAVRKKLATSPVSRRKAAGERLRINPHSEGAARPDPAAIVRARVRAMMGKACPADLPDHVVNAALHGAVAAAA